MAHDVAVLVGSLRTGSISGSLAAALIANAPASLRCAVVPIDMPLFNEDLESEVPAAWADFRAAIGAAKAILFVSPEYNRSMPGGLKNAIDVGSRPYGKGALIGKPAAVVTQAPGPHGASLANHAIRQALVYLDMPVLAQPEMYLPRTKDAFGPAGEIRDEATGALVGKFMAAFAAWVERFA